VNFFETRACYVLRGGPKFLDQTKPAKIMFRLLEKQTKSVDRNKTEVLS